MERRNELLLLRRSQPLRWRKEVCVPGVLRGARWGAEPRGCRHRRQSWGRYRGANRSGGAERLAAQRDKHREDFRQRRFVDERRAALAIEQSPDGTRAWAARGKYGGCRVRLRRKL